MAGFKTKSLDKRWALSVELPAVKARFYQIFRVRSVIALALMLWCAGTGCMVVSYAQSLRVETTPDSAAAEQSGAMDAHACCKARRQSAGHKKAARTMAAPDMNQLTEPAPDPISAMSCCPLTNGLIVTQSRSQSKSDETSAPEVNHAQLLTATDAAPVFYARPLRLLNQERSYLIGCAFLI